MDLKETGIQGTGLVRFRMRIYWRALANAALNLRVSLIVELYCINGVVIAARMHCDFFKIYCAPPNLGITRRLNLAQRPIFSGLRFFNELKIADSPGGLVLRIFTS